MIATLICMCGIGQWAYGQTASYSGVTSAIDTTHYVGPQGIATDAKGNLFVADAGSGTIYEMTRTGPGAYSAPVALAGPGGGYTFLRGVAVDSNGNLWVADYANYPAVSGQVYELVYNSVSQTFAAPVPIGSGWQSPWSIAPDVSGNVFVSDNSASTISEISGGTVTVVNTGGTTNPRGIAVDPSEDLFVIDGNTGRVMELAFPYTTASAVNNTGFTGPGDLALDASGNIWVAEYTTNLIRELTVADNYATILSWGSGLNGPLAVWPDFDGNMLVSDYGDHAIDEILVQAVNLGTAPLGSSSGSATVAFTFTGSAATTIAPPVVVTQGAVSQDFADAGSGTCTTVNGSGNPYATNAQCSVVVNFQPKVPGVRYGAVELLDTSGNLLAEGLLYGAGSGPQAVFNPGKATVPVTGFTSPQKVAVDGNGNAFVIDSGSSSIIRIPSGGGSPAAIATGYSFSAPYGIAIDGAGNLFVSESGANQVDEIFAASGYTVVSTLTPKFSGPIGLAVDSNDNLYVADASSTHAVEELTAASGYTVVETLSSVFAKPFGVAVDSSGNVFVADEGSTSIIELVAVNGAVPASPTTHSYGAFTSPSAIAVDAAGDVYVADNGGGTISELTAASTYATSITLAKNVPQPAGIAVDSKGDVYYTTNGSDNAAYELDLAEAPTLTFLSSPYGVLSSDSPQSVTISNIGIGTGSSLDFSSLDVSTTTLNAANSFVQVPGSGTPTDCSSTSTLSGGSSCNLSISFTPQYAEAIAGSAIATDNTLAIPSTTQTISLSGTGTKAAPSLAWANPASVTYGTSLSGVLDPTAMNGSDSVPGTFTYTAQLGGGSATAVTASTVLTPGTYSLSASFAPTDTTNFSTPSAIQVSLTVNQAILTVTADSANRAYGVANPTFTATITGFVNGDTQGTATSGAPSLTTTANTASPAGIYTITAAAGTLTSTNYTFTFVNGTLTVGQAAPTITWATPAAITYGTALSATQLDASSAVAGNFAYTPASGTVLGAGTKTLSVTLTPTDTTDYSSTTQTVQLVVNQATPTLTVTNPSIVYNGSAQAAAVTSSTSGTVTNVKYNGSTTVPSAAGTYAITADFTPTDSTDFASLTGAAAGSFVIGKATPTITWATPAAITYGTPLSATQLDATSTVGGSLAYTPASGTVLSAGTQTLSVTLTPTDTTDYNNATQTVQIVVSKGTPVISWATPAAISYGTPLSATQLDATSTVAGALAYTPASGTVLGVGTQVLSVTLTPADTTDYTTASQTVQIVVNKATPAITWATPSAINYGTALSSTQLDATTTVAGSFVYSPASGTVLPAGTQTLSVSFTPTDTTNYTTATQTVQLLVNKAGAPTITWATPAAITYGTALGAIQLDASATIPGSFAYSPVAGTVLQAGTQTLSVTFSPTDNTDYPTSTQTVQIVVNKATPTVTWNAPAAITYGTALSGAQLNATASVPGTFAYTPASGTVPTAGTQTLSVTFTPTDATDYANVTQTVQIIVNKATPVITWSAPAAINYGTALSSTQLDAASTVPGTFVYTPASGTVLATGTHTLSVELTPNDSTDYNDASQTVQITVNQGSAPTITWTAPAAINYGTALSAAQLDATASIPGSFVYTPVAGTVLSVGTQTLSVTFTPTDTADYPTATKTVQITVNQAPQAITFAPPVSVAYGSAPITLTATGGASENPVTFTLVSGPATLTGSTLTLTGVGTVVVDANQAGNSNYLAATQVSKSILVTNAVLTVTANNLSRSYGAANPTFAGSITGAVSGDTFTESFSTTATSGSPVGTYAIVPAVSGANASSYTVNIQNGTLTVTQASTTTALTVSSSTINPGQSVTLNAAVASTTTGTPTGTVSFYDGSTLLGTGMLTSGTASYSATGLLSGGHSITAVYGGDTNFTGSSTTAATTVTVAALDFTFAVSGSSSQSVQPGSSATFQFALNPSSGNYPGTVSFAASGLPTGATVTFSPSSVAVTDGQKTVSATVATASGVGANVTPAIGAKLASLGLALILLPLAGAKRMRRQGRGMSGLLSILLVLGGLAAAAAVSGCGSDVSKKSQRPQSYTITITATGGGVEHAANVTLEVQ